MKKLLVMFLTMLTSMLVFAHAPLLDVTDNNDGYLYIEGGYSNGEDATGTEIWVVENKNYNGSEEVYNGKLVIFHGYLEKGAQLKLPKPKISKYIVVFDGGPGHELEKKGPKLTKDEMAAWEKAIATDTKLGKWKDKWLGKVK